MRTGRNFPLSKEEAEDAGRKRTVFEAKRMEKKWNDKTEVRSGEPWGPVCKRGPRRPVLSSRDIPGQVLDGPTNKLVYLSELRGSCKPAELKYCVIR
ncbi:hypothetical protein Trydic_g10810 [Trypoxylus dichotomus]